MNTAQRTLTAWWRATGLEPVFASAGEEKVREIELRYRVSLPEDFRTYLLHGAPEEDFLDGRDTAWWSPSSIRNVLEEYEHSVDDSRIAVRAETCLFFADYSIWCWAWAICCDDSNHRGKVALIGGTPDRFVTDSFTDFVRAYVADPRSVS